MRLVPPLAAAALVLVGVSGCATRDDCDPDAVAAAQQLGAPSGLALDFHGTASNGCLTALTPSHPRRVLGYYARAMHEHGWTVGRSPRRVLGVHEEFTLRADEVGHHSVVIRLGSNHH